MIPILLHYTANIILSAARSVNEFQAVDKARNRKTALLNKGGFAYFVGITRKMRSRMIQYAPFFTSVPPRLAGFLTTLNCTFKHLVGTQDTPRSI
jgi:hypothetical protein